MTSSKPRVNPSRSPQKNTKNNFQTHNYSPSYKKTPKKYLNLQYDIILQNLKNNRQNLCACFDIYQLLLQNDVPQRCMQHNNFITLYCQTERKLICVNCIYAGNVHKLHNVVPVKNSFEDIEKDNKKMHSQLKYQIDQIKDTERQVLQYNMAVEGLMKQLLHSLETQYTKITTILNQRYEQTRKTILTNIGAVRKNVDQFKFEVQWLRETYMDRQISLPNDDSERSQIFNHMILSTLMQSEGINFSNIPKGIMQNEIREDTIQQWVKLRKLVESNWNSTKEKSKLF